MIRSLLATVVALAIFARVSPGRPIDTPASPPLPLAALEDYRRAAGTISGDTVHVALDVQRVRWRPEGRDGAELPSYSFVERGRRPRVPGPLLRGASGSVLRVALRNTLPDTVLLYGLQDHAPGRGMDSLAVPPGAQVVATQRLTAAGTYFYYGRLRPAVRHPIAPVPDDFPSGEAEEGPFVGTLIVDPPGTTPDPGERIMLLTRWLDDRDARVHGQPEFKVMVNGASWPFTERLHYAVGDTVRWRVINAMAVAHPMHLHGFYFRITARGDGLLDTLLAPASQRLAVTEELGVGHTMALTWVPERVGNWLFHCHLVRHMAPVQRIEPRHAAHVAAASVHHAEENMAGLVMGIEVTPRAGAHDARGAVARATGRDVPPPAPRRLRLVATSRPRVFGDGAAHAFVLQAGEEPAPDSIRFPGSLLTLRRGEPTEITVVNRVGAPLAVHWHGMEIESWFDGVGGWSGAGRSVRPPIAPGDSFIVRMTPPRAGTFIYHTHDEAGSELGSGLYGALIVEEPTASRDSTRDHVVVYGMLGHGPQLQPAVNGSTTPTPLVVAPGTNRLRLVSIPVDEVASVALVQDTTVLSWRPVARDGAELPAAARTARRAMARLTAGQTLDVEVDLDGGALRAGRYALRVRTRFYPTDPREAVTLLVPLRPPS